jgi:acyl dehydratase
MPTPKGYSVRTLKDFVGHDFGASAPIEVDQLRINGFADVTGDHQWIHVDVDRAKKHSPFGGPVAHGFLTLSLMAAAIASAGVVPADAEGVINYGLDKIRFLAPVPSGANIRARFKLAAIEDRGSGRQLMRLAAQVDVDGSDKPAIIGEVFAMVVG